MVDGYVPPIHTTPDKTHIESQPSAKYEACSGLRPTVQLEANEMEITAK